MGSHHDILRDAFRDRAAPLVRWIDSRGITADQVSVAGCVLCCTSGALILAGGLEFAAVVFMIGSAMDALDGDLARGSGSEGPAGAVLDSVLDRVGEGVVFTATAIHLAATGHVLLMAVCVVAMLGGMLTSYIRSLGEAKGVDCELGWFLRTDRVVVLSVGLLFGLLPIAVWIIAASALATAFQRFSFLRRELAKAGEP